jgi:hypothetical protein
LLTPLIATRENIAASNLEENVPEAALTTLLCSSAGRVITGASTPASIPASVLQGHNLRIEEY